MAEKNNSWFGSFLNAAKNRGSEMLEFVKTDLEEIGSAVKTEVNGLVTSTGSVLEKTLKLDSPDSTASTMKRSFSSFLGQVNTVLNPSPDDSDTEAILIVENSETVTLTKLQQAIYQLQKDPATFLADPDDSLAQQYQCWLSIIEDQLSAERIEKHLNSSTLLEAQYSQLVPGSVEHSLFWKRYLFKKALVEDDIARQEAMEKRELLREKEATTKEDEEENVSWDREQFASNVELTEEQQIQLLEQYESETKQSKSKRQSPTKRSDKQETPRNAMKTDDKVPSSAPTSSSSSMDEDWEKISDIDK